AFIRDACERLGAPLERQKVKGKRQNGADTGRDPAVYLLPLAALPVVVRERVAPLFVGRAGKSPTEALVGFDGLLPEGVQLIGRLHPLAEALAEYLLDSALEASGPQLRASRSGVMRSETVARRTTLLLLRLRLLIETADRPVPQLAEELIVAGFTGRPGNLAWLDEATARELLDTAQPAGNLAPAEIDQALRQALDWLPQIEPDLNAIANARGVALLEAHWRVRQTIHAGRVTVRPQLPLDVL